MYSWNAHTRFRDRWAQIAHGATFDEILQGYPDLEKEDIQQAIETRGSPFHFFWSGLQRE